MNEVIFEEILKSEEYGGVSQVMAERLEPLCWADRETMARRWIDETFDTMAKRLGEDGAVFAIRLAIGRAIAALGVEFADNEHAARMMAVSVFGKHQEAAAEFFGGAPEGATIN